MASQKCMHVYIDHNNSAGTIYAVQRNRWRLGKLHIEGWISQYNKEFYMV